MTSNDFGPGSGPVPGLDAAAWVAGVEDDVQARPGTGERAWVWAYAIHALAHADLMDAGVGETTDAVWVAPQMAWAMDDLLDAGVRTRAPLVPPVRRDDLPAAISTGLRRLIATAGVDDPTLPMPLAEACAWTVQRAAKAFHAYAGALP